MNKIKIHNMFVFSNGLLTACLLYEMLPLCSSTETIFYNAAMKNLFEETFENFDKHLLPTIDNQSQGHFVNITVSISNIYDVSEKDFSFKVDYNMQLHWQDNRFKFQPVEYNQSVISRGSVPFDRVRDTGMFSNYVLYFLLSISTIKYQLSTERRHKEPQSVPEKQHIFWLQ